MTKALRDPIIWMFLIVGLIGILTPISLLREVGTPFGGFVSVFSIQDQVWKLHNVTPPWWSGISTGNLIPLESLLRINGQDYGTNSNRVFQEADKQGDSSVTLEIKRGSLILTKQVPIQHLGFDDFLDLAAPNFINSLCYWIVALGVYLLRPKDRLNRIFAATCCAIAATQSLTQPSVLSPFTYYSWACSFLWALISPFVGVTIFHLSTVFPIERSIPKWLPKLLYSGASILGGTFALAHIPLDFSAFLDRWCFQISMIVLFAGWATLILTCVISWLIAWKKSYRHPPQITIALFSSLICAVYIVPIVLEAFGLNSFTLFLQGLDTRYFLVSVPLGFAIISLRYKSFRSSHPPFWLVTPLIISISALVASLFAWCWWRFSQSTMSRPPFGQVLLICLFSIILWVSLSSLRGFLARMFNWETISNTLVQQFSQGLIGNTNLVSLSNDMVRILTNKLNLEQVALWLWNDETFQFELSSVSPPALLLSHHLTFPADLTLTYSQPFRLGSEQNPISAWLKMFIDIQNWEIALPLGVDRPVGLILLGQRLDDEIFEARDLETLTIIARQATLFLFSAQVTYWLDKAQEDERFRIAQDLHDTIQQSLNAVAIHLHMIQKLVYRDTERAELFALECQDDIKQAIRNLYEIRRSLDPNELAHGLVEPLQLAIGRARRIRGLGTNLTVSPDIDESLSPQARRAIYRMIKQAMDNTLTHADARNFNVRLEIEGNKMSFTIDDDGKGSTSEQRNLALASGHLGLKNMRTRVESLGGEFIYNSQPGDGTQITGWIPIF